MYLNKYPAQYINCMAPDSKFITFINHAIQFTLDLTLYPHIWAVLLILLETKGVNTSYMQPMHDYYKQCYTTWIEEYVMNLEKASERTKNNMYNNTLDGVSARVSQSVQDVHNNQLDNMRPMLRTTHDCHIILISVTYWQDIMHGLLTQMT